MIQGRHVPPPPPPNVMYPILTPPPLWMWNVVVLIDFGYISYVGLQQ